MKKITTTIIALLLFLSLSAQDITGAWHGVMNVMGQEMSLSFNISLENQNYTSTMDSHTEEAYGIPMTLTSFENNTLTIKHEQAGIEYKGTLEGEGIIKGTFNQSGYSFDLNLSRERVDMKPLVRPQEPSEPYNYYSEDVIFGCEDHTLSGTLTLPSKEGKFPVVVLISGSGPQDRNEEILGHKPFLILADYLTNNGIGVLRYDDRGTAESTGEFKGATSADFSNDAEAAVKYLLTRKEVDKKHIGLAGHSEGGIIAPMVASRNKNIDFIVLLAGPGLPLDDLLLKQQDDIMKMDGSTPEEIELAHNLTQKIYNLLEEYDGEELENKTREMLQNYLEENPTFEIPEHLDRESYIDYQVNALDDPWMSYLLAFEPAAYLREVKCPVLAINGSKDIQVAAKENLDAIEKALTEGKNKDFTIKEMENLNHLFQTCETGSVDEYATIEETFAPLALNEILNWIQQQVK